MDGVLQKLELLNLRRTDIIQITRFYILEFVSDSIISQLEEVACCAIL